jgi:TonB-dependent receptor
MNSITFVIQTTTTNAYMPFKNYLFLLAILFSSQYAFSQTASLHGNIFDAVTKDGLPGAYAFINKTSFKKAADDKGNFEINGIPPGEYDITIEHIGYLAVTRHIVLKAGETSHLLTSLTPDGKSLGEVTVFGKADREKESGSRDRERNAANMMNVISSQAMVRSPDISAANVLQRMSGVTIQRSDGGEESYAIIRGMSPRYNNTLLNGIKIANPDAKNRYVQLGIVPSDILSSIEISKSLTPDMEGDATGGTVNMVVKDAPDKTSFKATASVGYSQLFFDEKYVAFPTGDIQDKSPIQRNPSGYVAQPGDFSRSNLAFWNRQALPTTLAGFSFTHRYLHDHLGVVVAENVQNQYFGNTSFQAGVSPGSDTTGRLHPTDADKFKTYTNQLNNGLVGHLDYVINEKNKINLDNFYLYSYLAQTRLDVDNIVVGTGYAGPGTGQFFSSWQSRTQKLYVENVKLSGEHVLSPSFRLDWAGVYSEAGNRQPDVATINTVYLIDVNPSGQLTQTANFFDGISRSWQNNHDNEYSGIGNLSFNHKWNNSELQLKAGGLYRYSSRTNTQDDYNLVPPTTNSSGGAASKPVWDNINDAQWVVFNSSGTGYNPNNYKATETIYDGYAMARFKSGRWETGGGLRVEHTDDEWNIRVHIATSPSYGGQIYQDFLPSAFLKYSLSNREFLHFSYFRSIARPNYYELVPAQGSISTTSGSRTDGNPYVVHSVADNFDVRYELFPKGEQHLFVGAFYKHIQNPIELQLESSGSGIYTTLPVNSNPANNLGGEVSFTQYWGRFGVTGNYTYTHSTISSKQLNAQGETVQPTRPMQGQTDHIVNLSLLYKDTKHGAFAQLAYEYIGNTLASTGQTAGADLYQRPENILAFSCEKDIRKHFTVFAKLNNLLNTPNAQYVQQTTLVLRSTSYADYSVGVRYAY